MRDLLAPLTLRILEAISVSLGLDRNFLPDLHKKLLTKGNRSDMRSLYYPAIKGDIFSKPYCEKMKHAGFFLKKGEITPGLTRCADHFDYGTVTLLFQDDMAGLEVKDVGDGWIPAPPIPGCILVNSFGIIFQKTCGEALHESPQVNLGIEMEILTNGRYIATRHRVVVPEEEAGREQPRQSFAFFVNVDDDVMLEPVNKEEPKSERYRPVLARKNLDSLLSATYG